jgi:hypothetical protein
MSIENNGNIVHIELEALERESREYYIVDDTVILSVAKGDTVEAKQIIAKSKETKQKIQVSHPGRVTKITDTTITIEDLVPEHISYESPIGRNVLVREGDIVKIGAKLTE